MDTWERVDACLREAGYCVGVRPYRGGEGVEVFDLGALVEDRPFLGALYRAYLLSGSFAELTEPVEWCQECWVEGWIAYARMVGLCPCRMSTESGESAGCPPSGDTSVTTDGDEVQVGL